MTKIRSVGGAPVAEGLRLESGSYTVFAVRNESHDIAVRVRREPRKTLRNLMRVPLLRGIIRLARDIIRYFDGLAESSELLPQHAVRGFAWEEAAARVLRVRPQTLIAWGSALLLPVIAFLCLYAAPRGAELTFVSFFQMTRAEMNMAVTAVRIVSVLLAIRACGNLRVLNRLRMYRGAFHKCLNCYESREEITQKNARKKGLIARRSECSFLISVLLVSLSLFPLLRPCGVFPMLLKRLGILLLTAALLNEPMLAMEKADRTPAVRVLRAPYDFFQLICVREPHEQMLEVAVCAMNAALDEEKE